MLGKLVLRAIFLFYIHSVCSGANGAECVIVAVLCRRDQCDIEVNVCGNDLVQYILEFSEILFYALYDLGFILLGI